MSADVSGVTTARESKIDLSEKLDVGFAPDGKNKNLPSGAKLTSSFSDKSNLLCRAFVTSFAVAVENRVYIISLFLAFNFAQLTDILYNTLDRATLYFPRNGR